MQALRMQSPSSLGSRRRSFDSCHGHGPCLGKLRSVECSLELSKTIRDRMPRGHARTGHVTHRPQLELRVRCCATRQRFSACRLDQSSSPRPLGDWSATLGFREPQNFSPAAPVERATSSAQRSGAIKLRGCRKVSRISLSACEPRLFLALCRFSLVFCKHV